MGGDAPATSADASSDPAVPSAPLGTLSTINPLSPLFLSERGTGGVGSGAEDDANPSQDRSGDRGTSLRTANVQFLFSASREGLRVVSLGMERAVKQAASRSGQRWRSSPLMPLSLYLPRRTHPVVLEPLTPTHAYCFYSLTFLF